TDEEAATVIREMSRRVRKGEVVNVVCLDLNRRGIRAPGGGLWSISTVRGILLNPRVAGYFAVTLPGKENWQINGRGKTFPEILTEDEWSDTVAALRAGTERKGTGRRIKNLLAGHPRCAGCSARLFLGQNGWWLHPASSEARRRTRLDCTHGISVRNADLEP